ncbi:MAG: PEP-CTERM sorting domain-containing protein [Armatimonadota bacterium]
MNKRIIGQFGTLAAFLLVALGSAAMATPQYSLAVSSSTLYQVKMDGSTMSSKAIFSFSDSSWGRSVTTYDDHTILVTEVGTSGSSIRKLQISSTGVTTSGTISLIDSTDSNNKVRYANSIAVDSNHGIYVGDSSTETANYAYISTLSGDVSVNTISTDSIHAPLCDVAATGTTGIIISQHDADVNEMSFITALTGGSAFTKSLEGSEIPRYPVAVAANGNYAYVVSEVLSDAFSGNAALSVYNIAAGTASPAIALIGFVPTDVTTFAQGGIDYVALIGKTSGGHLEAQAWQISGGSLTLWKTTDIGLDGGVDFQCAASSDGSLLWFNQPTKNSVGVLNTSTWTYSSTMSTDVGDQITGLVAFAPNMTPVPEPSSLLALASFGAGALGFFRRRKYA